MGHVTETKGQPVFAKARRLSAEKLRFMKDKYMQMLANGDIKPGKSPWVSPITVCPKKGPEKWRICGDYRALNNITKHDYYPIPNMILIIIQLAPIFLPNWTLNAHIIRFPSQKTILRRRL